MATGQAGAEIAIGHGPTLTCNHEAPIVAHTLRAEGHDASEDSTGRQNLVPITLMQRGRDGGPSIEWRQDGSANALLTPNGGRAGLGVGAVCIPPPVAFPAEMSGTQCASAEGISPSLSVKHTMAVAFAENNRAEVRLVGGDGQVAPQLVTGGGKPGQGYPAIAIQERAVCENPNAGPDGAGFRADNAAYTMEARTVPQAVATPLAVRRLTPRECERLQGFPDDFTLIPTWKNPASRSAEEIEATARWIWTDHNRINGMTWEDALALARHPDGPRYKSLGNSWAVNCAEWIGERIAMVDAAS